MFSKHSHTDVTVLSAVTSEVLKVLSFDYCFILYSYLSINYLSVFALLFSFYLGT
jgi:hypothetical protein